MHKSPLILSLPFKLCAMEGDLSHFMKVSVTDIVCAQPGDVFDPRTLKIHPETIDVYESLTIVYRDDNGVGAIYYKPDCRLATHNTRKWTGGKWLVWFDFE